jgi:hypothetical protein
MPDSRTGRHELHVRCLPHRSLGRSPVPTLEGGLPEEVAEQRSCSPIARCKRLARRRLERSARPRAARGRPSRGRTRTPSARSAHGGRVAWRHAVARLLRAFSAISLAWMRYGRCTAAAMKWLGSVVVAALLLLACGSTVAETGADGGPNDGDAEATASDAGNEATGPLACGSAACGATEYCIVPCSGGSLPICIPPANGACPSGTRSGMCLGDGGPTPSGCVTSPPPPYCSESPTCNGSLSRASGRRIDCLCL